MSDEFGELATLEEVRLTPGRYRWQYSSVGGGGTGQVETSQDNGALFVDSTDGTFTTDQDGIAEYSHVLFRITLTGDARFWIRKIRQ